jgi:YidC/Oxa1 family membrane protein insertase
MFDLIATVLAFFYGLVHSYGLAIVLLTIAVMAVTSPLTYKGTKSMIQMQRLQPQMKAIQTKYRDDREKMNQEMLAFYKANNVNPVGGCLPMLIQIPVFFVLYRVVRGLTVTFTDVGYSAGFNSLKLHLGGAFGHAPEALTARSDRFNPSYVSRSSDLYRDLSQATQMKSWGIDLSESASKALSESFGHALPYLVLIALVLVTGIIQQRQIQGRQARSGNTSPVNSQQQMIMKVMPFFLPIFSFGVPAALVVYFLVSNVWRIGQQAFITRTLYSGQQPAAPIETVLVDETPAKSAKGGGRGTTTARVRDTAKRGDAAKREESVQAEARGTTERAARSPMGRNRRADANGAGGRPARPAPKPKPKPKPKPERAPSTSGRVTPPGSGSRSRKKKRT